MIHVVKANAALLDTVLELFKVEKSVYARIECIGRIVPDRFVRQRSDGRASKQPATDAGGGRECASLSYNGVAK